MSTHALTVFRTQEFDGANVANVSHIWRKLDGYPTCHGRELVRILSGREFMSISELIAETWSGLLAQAVKRESYWQYCPVLHSQRAQAEWQYSLSLRDQDGEMPRGGPCMAGPFVVWLEVKYSRKKVYEGPLDEYVANDDPLNIEKDFESKQKPTPPEDAHPQRTLDFPP